MCIDDEIPFEIPAGWEWARIKNICTVVGRIGFRGYTKEDLVAPGMGAISISPSNMGIDGLMHFSDCTYISWGKYEESPEIMIDAGDILVVKTGSSYGKSCMVESLPEKATINPQIAVLKNVLLDKKWLITVLNSPLCRTQFERYVLGTSIPTFSQEKLGNTLIPVSPSQETTRIVDIVRRLRPLINSYQRTYCKLQDLNESLYSSLKKSVLNEAIQGRLVPQDPDDEPAAKLLEKISTEKQRLVKEGKLKAKDAVSSIIFKGEDNKYYEQVGSKMLEITDEIPFDIPDTWSWCRLGNMARLSIGKTPARGDSRYWTNTAYNWVSISDMKDYGRISDTKEKVSQVAADSIFHCKISQPGDLIMSFKLTVGRTSIIEVPAFHNEAIVTINPIIDDNFTIRDYLFTILPMIANYGESKDAIKGKTLNSSSISALLIPLPPMEETHMILSKYWTLLQTIK